LGGAWGALFSADRGVGRRPAANELLSFIAITWLLGRIKNHSFGVNYEVIVILENVAIANALQLKAFRRRASRSGVSVFWPIFYNVMCAQSAISQLSIKILTSPLDSATQIS